MPSTDSTGKSISFERWINGMSEDEYADMLDESNPNGFSDAQEEKALNIRQPPTKQKLKDLELEQEFEEPSPRVEEKPRSRLIRGEDIVIESTTPTGKEPVIDVSGSTAQRVPTPTQVTPQRIRVPRTTQVKQVVKQAVTSTGRFIRRFFRV